MAVCRHRAPPVARGADGVRADLAEARAGVSFFTNPSRKTEYGLTSIARMDQRIVPARGEPHAGGGHPAWMRVALAEQGVRRCGRGESNPRIVEYNGCTNLVGYDDKVSWCSSFVNWCFSRVGITGTGSALARSWLEWGRALGEPAYGCVAVLMRDRPTSWKGHVGFYLRHDDERVYLFGGNQRGAVREYAYARSRLLSYRWPDERGLS
ncbi:TIGR02594 family protein [Burkholderia pseudomallei]|nr:hypothetical protein T210_0135385 [Burkholderia pseudomallei MSHR6137]MBM5591280.1 TIGR02594 family protein [Burkholderia pseudomallei]